MARSLIRSKYLIITLLANAWWCTHAQENQPDSLALEQQPDTLRSIPFHFGLFLEGGITTAPSPNGFSFSSQAGFGVSYEYLSAGVFLHRFEEPYDQLLIFPNEYRLNYTYGGGYLGLRFFRIPFFEGHLRVNYARGDMTWEQKNTKSDFLRDEFEVIQPEILAGFVPLKYTMIFVSAGYRQTYHLNLTDIDQEDFSGFVLGLGLRVGFYN